MPLEEEIQSRLVMKALKDGWTVRMTAGQLEFTRDFKSMTAQEIKKAKSQDFSQDFLNKLVKE
jgi:hypothetical protein